MRFSRSSCRSLPALSRPCQLSVVGPQRLDFSVAGPRKFVVGGGVTSSHARVNAAETTQCGFSHTEHVIAAHTDDGAEPGDQRMRQRLSPLISFVRSLRQSELPGYVLSGEACADAQAYRDFANQRSNTSLAHGISMRPNHGPGPGALFW